jgi:hypothetical protein
MTRRGRRTGQFGSRRVRRGQMLLMFFFFLLAFLPLMALIVDFSLVRLVRRQMQSEVNTAALEGLRGKGLPLYDDNQLLLRRQRSQALRLEGSPPLELNLENRVDGDMVAGFYLGGGNHHEGTDSTDPDYPFDRADFTPDETGDSFLARRRRTDEAEAVPGTSSRREPVPLIFGHFRPPPIEQVQEHGVTVRAVAIAQARPAMIVGPAYPDLATPLSGAAPFAIDAAAWQVWNPAIHYLLVAEDEQSRLDPALESDEGESIAVVWLDVRRSLAVAHPLAIFLGDWVESAVPATGRHEYYLPLYDWVPSATGNDSVQLVVGFGGIAIERVGEQIQVTRLPQFVAPHNAAAVARNQWQEELRDYMTGLSEFQPLDATERETVLRELIGRAWSRAAEIGSEAGGLLAPALVRSID